MARRNKVQDEQDKSDDTTRLQVAQALSLIHHGGALEVAHKACRVCGAVSRVPVGFLVGIAARIEVAREGDGDAATWARKAEVRPDAGTSLAGGFDAAGHATKGGKEGVLWLGQVHYTALHSTISRGSSAQVAGGPGKGQHTRPACT
jgi:hypothetical protein